MINLSNGHAFEYMVASGALGFDGKGWLWEKPLQWVGLIEPELFTVVIRTLTLKPRLYPVSNLSWIRPWTWLPWNSRSCIQFMPDGGIVNKVGLYNPGIHRWCNEIASTDDFQKWRRRVPLVGSIFGDEKELVEMAWILNHFHLVGLEVNVSCPNTGHAIEMTQTVVRSVQAVKDVSRHPVIVKISVDHDYLAITRALSGIAEAVSINSVPWATWVKEMPDPKPTSPVEKIGNPNTGGGGVSGKLAQKCNWRAVKALARQDALPVIGPSVMEYEDIEELRKMGASAISFGAIHLRTPWRPTNYVIRDMREQANRDSLSVASL